MYQLQPLPHLQLEPQPQFPPQEDILIFLDYCKEGLENILLRIEFTRSWTCFEVENWPSFYSEGKGTGVAIHHTRG